MDGLNIYLIGRSVLKQDCNFWEKKHIVPLSNEKNS